MIKKDTFCIMPFICMHNMSNGLMKMCCITEDTIVDDLGKQYYIGNQDIDTVWNSKYMIEKRNRMLKNKEILACKNCYHSEESSGQSLRTEFNKNFKEKYLDYVKNAEQNNGKIKKFPPFIELRSGNECNTACKMCNSNDSSLVYKENTQIINSYKKEETDIIGDPEKIIFGEKDKKMSERVFNLNNHYDDVVDNIKDIKFITISGGEPFLLEKTFDLLEIISKENPSIQLMINTNGSIVNDRIINPLKNIKDTSVCVSVDGYGSIQEYIRYPLKWNKIEDNINKLHSAGLKINFNITVQAFNILHLEEIIIFLIEKFNGHINLNVLTNPSHFCIQNLPQSIKNLAANRITTLIEKLNNMVFDSAKQYLKKELTVRLHETILFMKATEAEEIYFENLKKNIYIYDKFRNKNILNYIPEWKQFL